MGGGGWPALVAGPGKNPRLSLFFTGVGQAHLGCGHHQSHHFGCREDRNATDHRRTR